MKNRIATYQNPFQSPVYGQKNLDAKNQFEVMLSTVKAEDMADVLEGFTRQLSDRLFRVQRPTA